jgi:rRNA pseudouridine-1189 N-methylase Emg1 (Nep1/Mra1 family)
MVTLLLAETQEGIDKIIEEVENMCHSAEMGLIIHHHGDDLGELLDSVEGTVIVFSPNGKLTLDEVSSNYGPGVVLVVGGFTEEKELDQSIFERAQATVSLGKDFLELTEVVEQIIEAYEKTE